MSGSTLDPDNIPARRGRKTAKGHDTKSLGPSDSSDSGSDMAGPGLMDADALHLDRGTNEDMGDGRVGDREMDDTSDAAGTGEHLTAGVEPRIRANQDRGVDRIVGADEAGLGRGLDEAEKARRKNR